MTSQGWGLWGLCRLPWRIVRENRRAYLALNLAYYGLAALAMGAAALEPRLHLRLTEWVAQGIRAGGLAPILRLYASGNVAAAAAGTLAINLLVGSFASITLPSVLVPFSGLLVAGLRAILWGLIFTPDGLAAGPVQILSGALIALVLILEGQGYVLTMLAAYDQGRAWLRPATVGAVSRRAGYTTGLRRTLNLYILVMLTLAVAGLVEAVAAIVIIPRLA